MQVTNFDRMSQRGGEFNTFEPKFEFPLGDPTDVQQVVDNAHEVPKPT